MKIYDIIIIGGGVVGASIARELSRYKLNIALLEKEEEVAFGVSKSNSGIIHPGTQNPAHSLKGALCVQGNILTRKISQELNVDFKEVGELIIAFNEEYLSTLLALKKEAEILKVPKLKIVNRDWLKAHEPNLSDKAILALYAPTAGIISPYRLVYSLCENAAKNGIEIYTQNKVENIIFSKPSDSCEKPFFEIFTSKNSFKSRYLINAAGLFADEIAKMLGFCDFTIRPRKGEEFILDKKQQHLTNHLLFPLPSKTSKGILIIRTADGNPMIGPTAEDTDNKEDLSTSDEGLKKVISAAQRMIPSINESDIIAYFAGLRPVAGDDFIIRHEDKTTGFINVAGIQSPGLTAAPAIAVKVCDILKNNGLLLKKKNVFHKANNKCTHLFAANLPETERIIKSDPRYGDIVCRCEMVSAKEIKESIEQGAKTLDGIKFRTRAQAGRCHGSFCTTRIMKILSEEKNSKLTDITKRGPGSGIIKSARAPITDTVTVTINSAQQSRINNRGSRLKLQKPKIKKNLVIVGAGPAGMAAAISAYENGVKDILLLERDQYLGGILNQCVHTGFGINYFNEDLTGPEYAQRFIKKIKTIPAIEISLKSFAVNLTKDKIITIIKPGVLERIKVKAVIMATGARERTREMTHIPGTRPAGIYSAGLAQKLINIEGLLPGKEIVIVGSGDIGLIMARRFTLEGAKVNAIIEIQKQSRGLTRNVVQCVTDFDIPFYLSHKISEIHGKNRVEKVDVVRVDENLGEIPNSKFQIDCDTILVSVGLIPENELIEQAGVKIDKKTNTPISEKLNTTSIPGLFVCGNSFKIYDLVDSVSRDSEIAGRLAAEYIQR